MKSRLILYISGILMYVVFRSFQPAPYIDTLAIVSDNSFEFNSKVYNQMELHEVIRNFRKTIPPDQRPQVRIAFEVDPNVSMGIVQDAKNELRKNGFLWLFYRDQPYWKFWK